MFRSYSGSKWGCRKKSVVLRKIKRCCKSKSLCQFWSNRLETNRTWSPNIRVHVLFVSKRSDQNWRSDFDLQRLIYDATNVETGADFGLKDRLPPFAIHIMNPLDMRFTRYHLLYTIPFKKIEQIAIEWSFFWAILVISEVGSPDYIAKSAFFKIWVFWVISMHYITLFVIDLDNIRCWELFLPLYDHFEIWRFLGPNWQY